MKLHQACQAFLSQHQAAVNLSEHSIRAYHTDIRNLLSVVPGDTLLQDVDRHILLSYIRHLRDTRGLKETSIKRRVACIKLLFKWAVQQDILTLNPFDKLHEKIKLPRRLPRALDRGDAHLLKALAKRITPTDSFSHASLKTAILLLLETGLRVGELCAITLDDLFIEDARIRIHGKGNRQRFVYLLAPQLQHSLRAYLERRLRHGQTSSFLFLSPQGLALTPNHVRQFLKKLGEHAGLTRKVTPHMLRHTCATQWLEAGLDIRYVQKLLGHHSISTTEIYTHVSDQGLREALGRAVGEGRRDN